MDSFLLKLLLLKQSIIIKIDAINEIDLFFNDIEWIIDCDSF